MCIHGWFSKIGSHMVLLKYNAALAQLLMSSHESELSACGADLANSLH